MASTSTEIVNKIIQSASASSYSGKPFDVFLNFRGVDTRYGFTDYLYQDLISAGVNTFRDDNELRLGEKLSDGLIKGIRESKISIPIFSKNYAVESKWCLRELAEMVECMEERGQKIFPIFYKVKPDEVKNYDLSPYARDPEVEKWKRALAIVGNPKGTSAIVGELEGASAIVGDQEGASSIVGGPEGASAIVGEPEGASVIVGGLQGSSATVGGQESQGASAAAGEPQSTSAKRIPKLKGLEVKNGQYEGELVKIIVKTVLSELKMKNAHLPDPLVGMDNHIVELKRQLSIYSNDVRVIGILGMSGIGKTTIAKVIYNELNKHFDAHCFLEDVGGKSQHGDGLISLQKQLVSNIRNREKPDVEDVDKGADQIKEAISGKKVFIVLDNVDAEFQIKKLLMGGSDALKIFCGAGSRFIITTTHEKILLASKVTDNYEPELMGDSDALKLFCLRAFKMGTPPDGFDNLAEEVVSNAGGLPLVLVILGSLLSVEKNKGSWEATSKKLMAIPHSKVLERLRISYDALDYQQKQIFLDIACFFAGVRKENPFYMWEDCGFFPSEGIKALARRSLIIVREGDNILRMHDRLIELGRQIVKEKVAEPYLKDPWKRSRLWDHGEVLETLRILPGPHNVEALCLDSGARNPPLAGEEFAKLPKLRYLSVAFRDLAGDFKSLHSRLRWLRWWGCSGNSTPINLYLNNLVILDLSYSGITDNWNWWSQIEMAQKLKVLNLSHCEHLARVPHLSNFASLESLQLYCCSSVNTLDGLEQLVSLSHLSMSHCQALERLPDLSALGKLRTLDVSACTKLTAIQGLENLESLELLDIGLSQSLGLPNLSKLRNLTSFRSQYCKELTEIQGLDSLRSLEHLDMSGCFSLKKLPDLSIFKKLRNLDTLGWKVTELQGLGALEFLEHLFVNLNDCLEILPDLSKLRRLRKLMIHSCGKLIEIQGLYGLVSLEALTISRCSSVKSVTDLSNLKRLRKLEIRDCEEVIEISDLDGLVSLENFKISKCKSLGRLPNLSNLRKLKELTIESLHMIVDIQGLERLESLENISISDCESITKLPDLPNFGKVKDIDLSRCRNLYEVKSLTRVVESLESLDLSSCKALGEIIHLPNFKNLKKLDIWFHEKLTEIRGLEELESLEEFNIPWCESIENLPDLSNLKNLKDINFFCCEKLTEIRGLEELISLKRLTIGGCNSLTYVPDLPNVKIVRD